MEENPILMGFVLKVASRINHTHIRLLEVLSGYAGEKLFCRLSAFPVRSAASYYAISYTWGDLTSTVRRIVNGKG
jgi:hypothetical protein